MCLAGAAAAIVGLTPARRRLEMAMPVVGLLAFLPTIPIAAATMLLDGAAWSVFDGLDADA